MHPSPSTVPVAVPAASPSPGLGRMALRKESCWPSLLNTGTVPERKPSLPTGRLCKQDYFATEILHRGVKSSVYSSFFLCCTTSSSPARWGLVQFAQSPAVAVASCTTLDLFGLSHHFKGSQETNHVSLEGLQNNSSDANHRGSGKAGNG